MANVRQPYTKEKLMSALGRIKKGQHHSWVSRDYLDIPDGMPGSSRVAAESGGVNRPLPQVFPEVSPCAWCEKESGEVQGPKSKVQSHTVCARHFCMTLLEGGLLPQMIKDRAVRMYGTFEGLAAFDTAVQLVANAQKRGMMV